MVLTTPIYLPILTLLELQSHFGDRPLKFLVVCPENGTPVLKGLTISNIWSYLLWPPVRIDDLPILIDDSDSDPSDV